MQDYRIVIRRELKARKWSVYRLAKESGVTQSGIGKYLNGDRQTLDTDTLDKIGGAFGLALVLTSKQ